MSMAAQDGPTTPGAVVVFVEHSVLKGFTQSASTEQAPTSSEQLEWSGAGLLIQLHRAQTPTRDQQLTQQVLQHCYCVAH